MTRRRIGRAVMTAMLLGAFAFGYVAGSMNQRRADAQGLGGILDQAGKAGGPLGAAGQLGSSIVEMQEHVSGLQKNLESLKKIQSTLMGK
jgi:hypothetical protein